MKIKESAENYLETIYMLQKGAGAVRAVDIANEMDFTPPSVSVAMKNLRENDFITADAGGFIILTEKGYKIAEKMYERHEFFAEWLKSLGVPEQTAVADACKIEHVISAESFAAIKGAVSLAPTS
ncbi:DtxR family transcriptional regulator [Clostridia bacterium]|nr:DtxR family transcriptional regulator [Clostridia bacterium]